MSIIIPLSLSIIMGYLTILTLFKDKFITNKTLTFVLSCGLGIGLNATITFYLFLLFNGYNKTIILSTNLAYIAILSAINFKYLILQCKSISFKFNYLSPIAWLLWGLILYVIIFLAKMHPYGEWDAWALYNMKMKFLLYSGEHWKDIFNKLHWYTQPDYPLLLPFINVNNFALSQVPQHIAPLMTSVVFAMLIVWVMFGAIKQMTHTNIAFVASFLLLVNPFYVFQSTAQYADTILAFYLLSTVICLLLTIYYSNKAMAILSGLMMGLMTFAKNEGIVMSILLIVVFTLYLLLRNVPKEEKKKSLILIPLLIAGFCLTSSSAIILKLFLAPTNKDIFGGLSSVHMKFLNWKGFTIIVDSFTYETTHKRWAHIWWFILALGLIANKRLFHKECKLFIFFLLLYTGILITIYLTTVNFDLSWRLKSTLHRICYYLLPSILFILYYSIFRYKKDIVTSNEPQTIST